MSGSKIAMIRGRTVFAKYCRRAISTARETTSENQKEEWDNPLRSYLVRGGVMSLGYMYGNYVYRADSAEVKAVAKKQRVLDVQMKELAIKELEYSLEKKKKHLAGLMKEAHIRKTSSQDKGD